MQESNAMNIARLQILADGLHRPEIPGMKKFYFGAYGTRRDDHCGTLGCAIGSCPGIFPGDWIWLLTFPRLINSEEIYHGGSIRDAEKFFDLSISEVDHLFIPQIQHPKLYGGKHLDRFSTAIEVADNIDAFITRKRS